MYINGLGFVDDNIYNNTIASASGPSDSPKTDKNTASKFDEMLASETARLNSNDAANTYSLKSIFKEASEKYNVSYDLLTAIAWHESRFQPDVTSSAGAMGLMQLMPGTAKAMGVENAYDPYENVMGAAKLLSGLSDMYNGDLTLTLAAYAAGTGSVAKYGGVPPYGETKEFVSTITSIVNGNGVEVPDKSVSGTANSSNVTAVNPLQAAYNKAKADAAASYTANSDVYDSFYTTSRLDHVLSYEDYQLLMYFFENMMEIVSNIGKTDNEASDTASTLFDSTSLFGDDRNNNSKLADTLADITNPSVSSVSGELANSIITEANSTDMGAIISGSLFARLQNTDNTHN